MEKFQIDCRLAKGWKVQWLDKENRGRRVTLTSNHLTSYKDGMWYNCTNDLTGAKFGINLPPDDDCLWIGHEPGGLPEDWVDLDIF